MPMKEGLHPSDIDRMVDAARGAMGRAMEARYAATEEEARHTAGHNARHAHRVLHALQTLDNAFPREVSATAREAREMREMREMRERQANTEPIMAQPGTTGDALDLNALAALDRLDTENSRALLALLESAQIVAECVDAERGHVLPEGMSAGPNGTRGIDLAESVNMLCHRLRGEIFGGNGRD